MPQFFFVLAIFKHPVFDTFSGKKLIVTLITALHKNTNANKNRSMT
jgi:uncharacterized membrane protein YcfT